MRDRLLHSMRTVAVAAAGSAVASMSITPTSAQAPAPSAATPTAALKTPWGEPDLQGIWKDEFDTPLQRSAKYAGQEFFTEAQRAELDKESAMLVERRRGDAADREFLLALLQATETCKSQRAQCQGGKYNPIASPRRGEPPPRYIA